MNIRQLEYFISVATNLNFTKAAKLLYISQSTLSEQISELEKMVGVKLFLRNTHAVQLTASGAAFLKEAKKIIKTMDESIQIARQAESTITGNLRIGILDGLEYQFLAKALRIFGGNIRKSPLNLLFMIYFLLTNYCIKTIWILALQWLHLWTILWSSTVRYFIPIPFVWLCLNLI